MKTTIITEFVKLEKLQTVQDEMLLSKADLINAFLKNQDGFIDYELVKSVSGQVWHLIYHFESMEKLRSAGVKLRSSGLFDEMTPLLVPGSMEVSFHNQIMKHNN